MFASPFQMLLVNLRQELPPASLYYLTKEEAYRRLKELSQKDFGHDDKLWETWGFENSQFLPGYEPGHRKSTGRKKSAR